MGTIRIFTSQGYENSMKLYAFVSSVLHEADVNVELEVQENYCGKHL
jgi:hypothetical protein